MSDYQHWLHADHAHDGRPFQDYLAESEWYQQESSGAADPAAWQASLNAAQTAARDIAAYKAAGRPWSEEKVAGYNHALDGKILIPQPFGTLRNLHESSSGFVVSKFMIVEVVVAVVLAFLCIRLAALDAAIRPAARPILELH